MLLQRTAKLRLHIHPKALRNSVDAYTKAFNHVCQYGWGNNVTSSISLLHAAPDGLKIVNQPIVLC